MKKLRKMLGDVYAPVCEELRKLIETQSKNTLGKWAVGYAEEHYLPIYEKCCEGDFRYREILAASRACAEGTGKLKDMKPLLREAQQIARETEGAVAQAAARALTTACSVIQTPTGALGFNFYGAAAVAYDEAGLEEEQAVYDMLAAKEFDRILESLQKAAIPDEENPAKINWNC